MIGSTLVKATYPAHPGNYTFGRQSEIKKVTIHHMAARWTAKRCGELFQTEGREGSSHYGIGFEGEIAQYVSESDTAWSDSDWDSNVKSISVECANESMGEPWNVSDATLESLIRLLADISLRNRLGLYKKGENLTWHQMYSATACPGTYLLSKMDEIVRRANHIISSGGNIREEKRQVTVNYQVFTNRWLENVSGHNPSDATYGYAGIFGEKISGVYAGADVGNVFYKVHIKGGTWLPEVKNREDFAGILGKEIDGVMIRSDSTKIHCQVHTKEDGWLSPVTGYDETDVQNGYAGWFGHSVDAVMIWADPILMGKDQTEEETKNLLSESVEKENASIPEKTLEENKTPEPQNPSGGEITTTPPEEPKKDETFSLPSSEENVLLVPPKSEEDFSQSKDKDFLEMLKKLFGEFFEKLLNLLRQFFSK